MDAAGFDRAAKQAARQLRRMPSDLRKEMGRHVQEHVTAPLAKEVENAISGPWAKVVGPTTKARIGTEPVVSVGAGRKAFSGGATANQVLYGQEFGGGQKRKVSVSPSSRQRPYRRKATVQFIRNHEPAILPTMRRNAAVTLERWLSVIDPFIERWEQGG